MMYVCYCCGEKFENPYEKCDRYVSRFSPEYGDTAVLVCPFCGGESFGKDDD